MAKKKKSATEQLLHTPISLPLLGILALIGTSLVSLNISVLLGQPEKTTSTPTTISQNTLQNVLGTSISIGDTPKPQALKDDPVSNYWQQIVKDKPSYRDGYITLAVTAFNKRNCQETRFYLDKAYDIDPDNQTLQELFPHLKSCLETDK